MCTEELDALADLAKRSDRHAWNRRHIEESFHSNHLCWGLEAEIEAETVIGFAVFQTVLDEAELLYLVIDQVCQQQGNASQLLTHAFRKLLEQGVASVFLEVRESNAAARSLYQRLGFQACGLRKKYYQPLSGSADEAENALLLRLTLIH
jgi:[ribosomal protein S18]-alanine N-acetyltransferase